jgi:hypothetical protein
MGVVGAVAQRAVGRSFFERIPEDEQRDDPAMAKAEVRSPPLETAGESTDEQHDGAA